MRLDDPELVRHEYASEERLAARSSAYRWAEGPDPREIAFRAVAAVEPRRVLEVGCGRGEFAERVARELGADVVALDQSERMVELTGARGIETKLGDVCELPFRDAEFDCALALWMLYHVAEVERALAELARVLRPGGRLVAVTNASDHWRELHDLLDMPRFPSSFCAEDAVGLLSRHFTHVEAIDASGWIVFPGRAEAQEFVDSAIRLFGLTAELPAVDGPLRVRRAPWVLVAEAAA